mmetsp:Transcript_881/g.2554  ORF Transcript_881/g.2554 Transcript_881/m.2554 type:complete len:280 (+) Transcript_881:956-1795(+)
MEKILSRSRIHRDRFGVIHLSNHTNRHGYVQFLRILHLRRKTSEQCVRYVSILLQRRRAFRRVCVFLLPQQIFSEEEKTRRRKPSSRKRGAIIRFHRSNPTKATPPPNGTIKNEHLPPRRHRRRRLPTRALVRPLPSSSSQPARQRHQSSNPTLSSGTRSILRLPVCVHAHRHPLRRRRRKVRKQRSILLLHLGLLRGPLVHFCRVHRRRYRREMENRRLGQTKDRYDVHHRTQLESSEKFCLLVRVLKTLGHRLDAFVAQVYPGVFVLGRGRGRGRRR